MAGKKGRSGRKPQNLNRKQAQAALYNLTRRSVEVLAAALEEGDTDVAKYIINHYIGSPRQREEILERSQRSIEIRVIYEHGPDTKELPGEASQAALPPS